MKLRQGSGAMSAEEVDGRDPFVGLRMGDVETARGEHCDGGIDVGVSHQRRLGALNHAIDSPRKGKREWRRRLRQLLRLRRKRRSFFIEFGVQICRSWLSDLDRKSFFQLRPLIGVCGFLHHQL